MKFWNTITGNDLKRAYRLLESRAETLPPDFRAGWERVKEHLWSMSDFSGRKVVSTLGGVLGLLEESAAEGQRVADVLGDDLPGFCSALMGEEGARGVREQWRQQLNATIAKKLSQ